MKFRIVLALAFAALFSVPVQAGPVCRIGECAVGKAKSAVGASRNLVRRVGGAAKRTAGRVVR